LLLKEKKNQPTQNREKKSLRLSKREELLQKEKEEIENSTLLILERASKKELF